MSNGLTSKIAQGIDITTPFFQGAGLARQAQTDKLALAQQQFANEQSLAQTQALQQQAVQREL